MDKILIIKHGAFGDLIQALGPMRAIRQHHPHAAIALMTTPPFTNLMRGCPFIDSVVVDTRPRLLNLFALYRLHRWFKAENFTRVYDLQNSDRSCFYFYLTGLFHRPEWVGTARGASHRNASPQRTAGRAFDGHVQTLALAGITGIQVDSLDWIKSPSSLPPLPARYALVVPGSSPQHPGKRWPAARYHAVARFLIDRGLTPVLIGTKDEEAVTAEICQGLPACINLCGKTRLEDLPALARGARLALGNDTGPMHMIACTGCPTLTLFDTRFSNPRRHQPLGPASMALSVSAFEDLAAPAVINHLSAVFPASFEEAAPESHRAARQSAAPETPPSTERQ